MPNLQYHAFRKPKKLKSGKTVHRWYYYYIDAETGKQVQKSCGTAVRSRQAAEDFIRTMPPPPEPGHKPSGSCARPFGSTDLLIGEIAKDMFVPGSAHVHRRQQLKKSVTQETLAANRVFMRHIIGTWGHRMLRSLELDEVMSYLFSAERSSSWKNQYISNLNEIYQEGQFLGCKVFRPDFPSIGSVPNKADILTQTELERFFRKENFSHDFFFLFFLCALSGGLRHGEVRALRARQIVFEKRAVIVDGYIKKSGVRTTYNKCGSPEHPKLRVVPYPDLTLKLLQRHVAENCVEADDYVFTYNGRPVSSSMAKTAFTMALIKAGIAVSKETLVERGHWKGGHIHVTRDLIPDGRRIIIHSLRYTYITLMSRNMDAHNLLKLTGHDSTAMVDYYNRTNLDMALAAIPNADAATSALLPCAIGKA